MERRKDPEDGVAYTYDEILAHYTAQGYKKKDVLSYWEQVCKPVKGKKAEAKASKAEPKAKAKAKAKAKSSPALRGAKAETLQEPAARPLSTRLPRARVVMREMKRRELDWRIGAVVYQIYVDRFAASSDLEKKKSLYPEEATFHTWEELPKGGHLVESAGYYSNELAFWGGDLPSMMSKMDYICDLGVDVMYLQPITRAYSNHKYDTSDYHEMDAQYGTDEDFKKLVETLHEKGLKLVLDFVFNHCGKKANFVQEALKDKESKFRKFFFLGEEYKPHGYKVWGCAPSLVELALETKELQSYLWSGKDSALAKWLQRGADGARLDVASEIGLELLSSITRAAHRHKKGSLVVGEVWAYSPHWTSAMDAVMSLHLGVLIYGVAEGTLPGPSAAQSLSRMIADSSMEEVLKCWIVVSNHDMPRLAHRLPDLQARKFAQVLQFTWPGCPLVYYGDELGLEGADDPHNRAPMPWGREKESEMLRHTKMLIDLRKKHRALKIGNYRDLFTRDLMAFIRSTDCVSDVVIVLANPTEKPVKEMVVVPVPAILGHTLFKDQLSGEELRLLGSTLTVEVKPKQARIFTMVNEVGNPSGDQYKRTWGHWASFKSVKP